MGAELGGHLPQLRGFPLLDATIQHIEKHPGTWQQAAWRCKTGMCVAGHMATLAGGAWLTTPDDECTAHMLVPEPYDRPADIWETGDGRKGVPASRRAERLLGVDSMTGDGDLFSGSNSLREIKDIRNTLIAEAIDRAEAWRDQVTAP